ncbi:hypothetical protein [Pseudodesulfovibrio sp.]|uniref:hypothetical protein n=1 Tax=Pseudodesulfovibrio sp. TaxID=2035812 RepID=UPI0026148699|nr:hypothetical protein [Pseudodesulfovibrio sp.]MDD3310633.1 hypothetical protein [Pseudodesulfovibrio sp.]
MKKDDVMLLTMRRGARTGFNTLLQRGFYLAGRSGMTVRTFLREVLGYDDARIEGEVRTVFLNSSPMDGLDTTRLRDGDRLALGSAMPGLVGICMGRDNPYKSFRSSIGLAREDEDGAGESIRVFVKIFSVLAVDTGEGVLARGIEVDRAPLLALIDRERANLLPEGGPGPSEILAALRNGEGPVRVRVRFA